jgi:hypothetical protein
MGKQGGSCVLCRINPVSGVVLLCLSKSAAFHFFPVLTLAVLTGPVSLFDAFLYYILFYFIFVLENHDGAPAATATSPLSKRKVFGG